jgi:5-methyltetrahydrofolate--homocysteine methyltransferase
MPAAAAGTADAAGRGAGKIVLATVKGDVHDIGKNITAVILGCNGYEIIDLGVMVPAETILKTAREVNADCVGLSGLISPSLDEMVLVAREMEKQHFTIPLLIGGAAASMAHTSLRIAPAYSGPVVYVRDAGQSAPVVRSLLSANKNAFLRELESNYEEARSNHERIAERRIFLSLEEARARRFVSDWKKNPPAEPKAREIIQYDDYPIEKIIPYLDWEEFFKSWEVPAGKSAKPESPSFEAREKLHTDAQELLEKIRTEKLLTLRAVLGFFPALSHNEDIILYTDTSAGAERGRFSFLRNQEKKETENLCLADFILPQETYQKFNAKSGKGEQFPHDWLGLFALSAGFGAQEAAAFYTSQGDDYNALLIGSLADLLAEAFAEHLDKKVRQELWVNYRGIRPAFGYAACPDHQDKKICLDLLEAQKRIGLTINEAGMITQASSVCGMYFAHPGARYFGSGEIAEDQLADWAMRKNISVTEAQHRTGRI